MFAISAIFLLVSREIRNVLQYQDEEVAIMQVYIGLYIRFVGLARELTVQIIRIAYNIQRTATAGPNS